VVNPIVLAALLLTSTIHHCQQRVGLMRKIV